MNTKHIKSERTKYFSDVKIKNKKFVKNERITVNSEILPSVFLM